MAQGRGWPKAGYLSLCGYLWQSMSIYENLWINMNIRVLMIIYGSLWGLWEDMGGGGGGGVEGLWINMSMWVSMGVYECLWESMDKYEYAGIDGYSWEIMDKYEFVNGTHWYVSTVSMGNYGYKTQTSIKYLKTPINSYRLVQKRVFIHVNFAFNSSEQGKWDVSILLLFLLTR